MKPELKAFKHYKKNIDLYIGEIMSVYGDNEKLIQIYNRIAAKFGASGDKLSQLLYISYKRSVERSLR